MGSHRRRRLAFAAALTLAATLLPSVANSEVTNPEVKAEYPQWSPEQEAVKPGKAVKFLNANGLPHGVRWTGGPATPSCTGVPIDSSSSSWNGSCTFQTEGTYTFECTVHPVMKGTIYVNSTGTVPPTPPTATTESASSITETTATLKGMVNPDGETTKYFFKWGTDTSYGHSSGEVTLGSADHAGHSVSMPLEGLAPDTTYHFRLVAKNGSGTVEGGDRTFTTSSKSEAPSNKEPTNEPRAEESSPTPTPTPMSPPSPVSLQPEIAPLVAPFLGTSVKLTAPRHSFSVHGSLEVSRSGAGGRLEIDLIAKSASLARARHKKVASAVVGRLVRRSVPAGKMSFSISLTARAKRALRRHHRLALRVKVTLTPPSKPVDILTRSFVLHA